MGSQQKWSQLMTPNSEAANFKNLQKSKVSSMSSVRHTTQSLTERQREPFRLSKNLWWKNNDRHLALLNYWMTPLPGIELLPAQLLMGHWWETSYQWWTAWFNLPVSTKRMFPGTWRRPKRIRRSTMTDMRALKWRTYSPERRCDCSPGQILESGSQWQ